MENCFFVLELVIVKTKTRKKYKLFILLYVMLTASGLLKLKRNYNINFGGCQSGSLINWHKVSFIKQKSFLFQFKTKL
jgi:hypothetical protein